MTGRRRQGTAGPRELRPNELSVELVPNRLSILEGARPATTAPRRRGTHPSPPAAPTRSRRSLSSLIGAAIFVIIIVGQVIAAISNGGGDGPTAGTAATSPLVVAAGTVAFGTDLRAGCGLLGSGTSFAVGSEVWWAARFEKPLGPADTVHWQVVRDEIVVSDESGPTDPPRGPWDGLCGTDPLRYEEPGAYALSVSSERSGQQIAYGTFELH